MKYLKNNAAIQTSTADVPCTIANADYRDILRRVRDEGLVIEPWVVPLPPSASALRDRAYRLRLDEYVRQVVIFQVLLQTVPDTVPNAELRSRVTARLAAAKSAILDVALQIETSDPAVP
jgi:hypothetical protein